MQISIDTSTDSHEHIRKVIELLKHVVGDSSSSSAPASAETTSNAFAGIFGDSASPGLPMSTPPTQDAPAPTSQQPQVVDVWGNPKKPDPDIGVEVY
jgi:hypothetical protein